MGRRRNRRPPAEPFLAEIEDLAHDGRGVARIDGKTVFVEGALPGERVEARYLFTRRSYDVAETVRVLEPSPERVEPRCPHFGYCGGCALQHLAPERQIVHKEKILRENLRRIGGVEPERWLPPLTGPVWGYRRKARLAVRDVPKKGRVLVGFRERHKPWVADMEVCPVLHPAVGDRLLDLSELIGGLRARDRIAQIEVAVADDATALAFRHLDPLAEPDLERLACWGRERGIHVWLQPGGPATLHPLWPADSRLHYLLPEWDLRLRFEPSDFTQVNFDINRAMVARALELLELDGGERVLDLFCGIGNFTLPLARGASEVVGVEGAEELILKARANAEENGVRNVSFHVADLSGEAARQAPWALRRWDRVLLDPPRSGALEILGVVAAARPGRIVYVACHPGSLARDAGELVRTHGYRLEAAGVMDMFPHTAHVESIALFVRA